MPQFAILSKLTTPEDIRELPNRASAVQEKILAEVPSLTGKWTLKLALLGGPIDFFDVVEAENIKDVQRAAEIISEVGHCTTTIVAVTHWHEFMLVTRTLTGQRNFVSDLITRPEVSGCPRF